MQPAIQKRGSFLHSDQSCGLRRSEADHGIKTFPLSFHLNVQQGWRRRKTYDSLFHVGMPRHIGEGFLYDPVDNDLYLRREISLRFLVFEAHAHAGLLGKASEKL